MHILLLFTGDISPPRGVRQAMEMQAEAERKKRAQILESEGTDLCFCMSCNYAYSLSSG